MLFYCLKWFTSPSPLYTPIPANTLSSDHHHISFINLFNYCLLLFIFLQVYKRSPSKDAHETSYRRETVLLHTLWPTIRPGCKPQETLEGSYRRETIQGNIDTMHHHAKRDCSWDFKKGQSTEIWLCTDW